MHFENILLLVKPLPHIHLKFSNETFGSLHLWSLNREDTMCSKTSILLRLDVVEPRFPPGLRHRRSNFHHVLCTVMSSSDVLLRQAMWRSQCPKRVQDAKSGRISPHFSTYIVCSSKSSQDVLGSHPGGFSRGEVRSLFSWLHISRVQAGLAHWKFFGLWQILSHLQHAWLLAHPGCSSFSCLV